MPEHDNRAATNAKRTLAYYFQLLADRAGVKLDGDCITEIEGIVDDVVDAAVLATRDDHASRNHEGRKEAPT